MDKRIQKTQHKIYLGFSSLLKKKSYNKITIEDMLKESNVSRSTFYMHFKTKEDVLHSISKNIFSHVFSHTLTVEQTHDFSHSDIFEYSHLITHILYHLHDEKELITAILSSESKELFLSEMRENVMVIVDRLVNDGILEKKQIPDELFKTKLCEDFVLCVIYWFKNDCKESPEKIKDYYFAMNK